MSNRYEQMQKVLDGLPQAAVKMAPDDVLIKFICGSMPTTVGEDNAKLVVTLLALLTRRLAVVFNNLAAEQEKLLEQWATKSQS